MRQFAHHFNATLQASFRAAIPELQRKLGVTPFVKHDATYGVGGNTFRALGGGRLPPSIVYRGWAAKICEELSPRKLVKFLRSRAGLEEWHRSLAGDLSSCWKRRQRRELSIAHRFKLVDLFIKWLSCHDFGDARITRGFELYAHCALDRQTLQMMNDCFSLLLPIRNPSMGDIHVERTYLFCQGLIAEFSAACGGTPLLFDHFAWKPGG